MKTAQGTFTLTSHLAKLDVPYARDCTMQQISSPLAPIQFVRQYTFFAPAIIVLPTYGGRYDAVH